MHGSRFPHTPLGEFQIKWAFVPHLQVSSRAFARHTPHRPPGSNGHHTGALHLLLFMKSACVRVPAVPLINNINTTMELWSPRPLPSPSPLWKNLALCIHVTPSCTCPGRHLSLGRAEEEGGGESDWRVRWGNAREGGMRRVPGHDQLEPFNISGAQIKNNIFFT